MGRARRDRLAGGRAPRLAAHLGRPGGHRLRHRPDPQRQRGRGHPGPRLRRHHDPRRLVALRPVRRGSSSAVSATPVAAVRWDGGGGDAGSRLLSASGGRVSPGRAGPPRPTFGRAVAGGRLANQLADVAFPPKTNPANERLAQHLWAHRDDLFTFLRQPGLDATNWRAELALRFGVLLRKVWGGSRTWAGARAQ